MSQVDEGLNPSVAEGEQEQGRLVSVNEAIKYRKRAQGAERRSEELAVELSEAKGQMERLTEELGTIRVEQKLLHKLTAAGVTDLEAAVLLARSRVDGDGSTLLTAGSDEKIDGVIEQLKKEKQYLFGKGQPQAGGMAIRGTAGAKSAAGRSSGQVVLERAALRAANTGDRKDLQEYLRVRRNYL
jgi:ABC-type Na+ efflux pump permease subunit